MNVQSVQGGQVDEGAAGGGGESQDCPSAMAVHLERKIYRTVVRTDRGAPRFTNSFKNNNTGVMEIVKVFEEFSTSSASSSSSSGRNIKTGVDLDNGGASPRKRRRTVRRGSAETGTPWSGWANRARPSSPSTSAGTSWSPRLGVPKSVTRRKKKELAITEPEGATSGRSGPTLSRCTPSSPSCHTKPGHTPPPPPDVPRPPSLPGSQATITVSFSPMGMGSGRRTTTNTLETGIRPELPGHVPGGQEDHQHGQRRHHQPRGQGGRPPGAGTGGEHGLTILRSVYAIIVA